LALIVGDGHDADLLLRIVQDFYFQERDMRISRALQLKTAVAFAISAVCANSVAIASDIEMSLQMKSAKQRVNVNHTEEQPSSTKPQPRPVFTSEKNEALLVSWKVTNVSKQETFQDVLIYCVVVSELKPGQETPPKLKDPVHESAITMDFKPGSSATGTFSLMIDRPGTYLVRVETRNMLDKHGHEHNAALDLVRK
jgi:hypothetical protein